MQLKFDIIKPSFPIAVKRFLNTQNVCVHLNTFKIIYLLQVLLPEFMFGNLLTKDYLLKTTL